MHCKADLLRLTSKSFLSVLNGRGPWRNPFEEKRLMRNEKIAFAALEQQLQRKHLALQHKNVIFIVLDRGAEAQYISFYFLMMLVWKKH